MSDPTTATQQKTVRLLTYWTQRYVMVLVGLLVLVALVAGLWLRSNAYEHSWQLLTLRANHLADGYAQLLDDGKPPTNVWVAKELRSSRYIAEVINRTGGHEVIQPKGKLDPPPPTPAPPPPSPALVHKVLNGESVQEDVQDEQSEWLRVGVPFETSNGYVEALFLAASADDFLPKYDQLYGPLALLIAAVGLAGWLVIYFLSRKLTQPLLSLTQAAQTIAQGSYDPELPQHVREQEFQQLILSFRDMAARLQRLEDVRSRLLGRVSHELRTPITSIRGMIQAVKNKVVTDEEAEEFLSISLDETKRLQKMVEELLSLSSFEVGATPVVERELIHLNELSAEVILQVQLLPAFAKLQVEFHAQRPDLRAMCDSALLRQILLNLLSNSASACSPGGHVILRLSEVANGIALDVEDDGRGIPEAEQPFIFERFYSGQSANKKSVGLGIGLTISRFLARAQEGDLILLHSVPGDTVFRLLLPRP
ncbi:MAG: HAMP domain-containing sensor histidine kinase [Tumebacillaceae bacterium]